MPMVTAGRTTTGGATTTTGGRGTTTGAATTTGAGTTTDGEVTTVGGGGSGTGTGSIGGWADAAEAPSAKTSAATDGIANFIFCLLGSACSSSHLPCSRCADQPRLREMEMSNSGRAGRK